ncbi:MAG: amidohydrolase family protein [Blastocatellia bacterium]
MEKFLIKTILVVCVFFSYLPIIFANNVFNDKEKQIAIVNVSIVDVEKGILEKNKTVIIKDNKIAKIETSNKNSLPKTIKIIDGKDLYLIPGLFDAHVHYSDPDTFGPLFIANGVTFVRDTGGFTDQIIELRDKINKHEMLGPEMAVTGAIVDGKPAIWPFSEPCDSPEEGRAAVKKLFDKGVNQIKVYSLLKKEVFQAIADEAQKLGIKIVGHIPRQVTLDEAMAAKMSSNEHLTGFNNKFIEILEASSTEKVNKDPYIGWQSYPQIKPEILSALLSKLAASNMVQCPTLVVNERIGRLKDPALKTDPLLEYVPNYFLEFWKPEKDFRFRTWTEETFKKNQQVFQNMLSLLGELHKAGVPLVCGTDLSNPYLVAGFSLHEEMRLFQQAKIPNADILRAATINTARLCGVNDRLGTIAENKLASMVLLRKNPLEDIKNTSEIFGVFLAGEYFDRAKLDEMLAKVKAKVAATTPKSIDLTSNLAGKVIFQGQYKTYLSGEEASVEDFVISQTETSYIVKSHNKPTGGGFSPSLITYTADKNFNFQSAKFDSQTEQPLTATYLLNGGAIKISVEEKEKKFSPTAVNFDANTIISCPSYAINFVNFNKVNLKVGESKTFPLLSFGFGLPSWQLLSSDYTITYASEGEIILSGKTIFARRYEVALKTPQQTLNGEILINKEGLMVASTYKTSFGKIEIVLETP